jgi:hypothetical protein
VQFRTALRYDPLAEVPLHIKNSAQPQYFVVFSTEAGRPASLGTKIAFRFVPKPAPKGPVREKAGRGRHFISTDTRGEAAEGSGRSGAGGGCQTPPGKEEPCHP